MALVPYDCNWRKWLKLFFDDKEVLTPQNSLAAPAPVIPALLTCTPADKF